MSERPLRPTKGGAYGSVSSTSDPANITIGVDVIGAEVYVSGDARIAIAPSTTDLTVNDTNFGYIAGGTTRVILFYDPGNFDKQIQLASRDGSAVTYHVTFLG